MWKSGRTHGPNVGEKVLLNKSGDGGYGQCCTRVVGTDGFYGEIDGLGVFLDFLEAKVVSEAYALLGPGNFKAFDIEISFKEDIDDWNE